MTLQLLLKKGRAYEQLMRLDKPIGILLLWWPTLWGLLWASGGRPFAFELWMFFMGTVLMRSAGCVINDWADRDFDGHVARTRDRPIVRGEVSSKEALVLASLLLVSALPLLLPFTQTPAPYWALLAALVAATYPFMKRWFAMPQAYLGLAFSLGIPMAFAAIQGHVPWPAAVLMLANLLLTVAYDTAYAMVDREDDLKIGIRTSAITLGRADVAVMLACNVLAWLLLLGLGWLHHLRWGYFLGLGVMLVIIFHLWRLTRTRQAQACFQAFRDSHWLGAAVALALMLHYWLPRSWL